MQRTSVTEEYHMNKNYIPANISFPIFFVRAFYLQGPSIWLNRYLFCCRRFRLLCVIAVLLNAAHMSAATITVTNGNDTGPGSLRQAIVNASSGDTINFAANVTTVNLTTDELVIDKNLTITGPRDNRLTVRRNTQSLAFRIFHIISSTVTAFISHLTISNGNAGDDGDGGGIRSAGVLTLTDCIISDNQVVGTEFIGGNGGGVLNESGTMTITRCTISNNSGHYFTGSSGDIPSGLGGGILNESGGALTITNSTISGNSCSVDDGFDLNFGAGGGGGVQNLGSMTIRNCTVSGNSVAGTGMVMMFGGGISNSGNLQITSSTIVYNSASAENGAFGGGVNNSAFNSTPVKSNSCIIALNTAPIGPDFAVSTPVDGLQYHW